MSREKAIRLFEHLAEKNYDVSVSSNYMEKFAPPHIVRVRVTVRPLDTESMKRFDADLYGLDVKYHVDSLSNPFANGVTFTLEDK